jgi:hypothetical protein
MLLSWLTLLPARPIVFVPSTEESKLVGAGPSTGVIGVRLEGLLLRAVVAKSVNIACTSDSSLCW